MEFFKDLTVRRSKLRHLSYVDPSFNDPSFNDPNLPDFRSSRQTPGSVANLKLVTTPLHPRLRIAAIDFLNPAPLMWDFEHAPAADRLAERYELRTMLPSACAQALSDGSADIGLIPIAALATTPRLRVLPGCTIASKGRVRSLILVRRSSQPLRLITTVAADTASRATVAYTRILFHLWKNPAARFIPAQVNLDAMLNPTTGADAAILIGDAALLALEDRARRLERTGEELVYHDLAEEWRNQTGLVWVSAVWCAAHGATLDKRIVDDFNQSRLHGLANINALVAEWSQKLPLPAATIRTYLTENIHYTLDEECIEGMRGFFRLAAETGVLPEYTVSIVK